MFLHKKADEMAVYRNIETDTGSHLKLTDFHLIYVSDCAPGDKLQLVHAKDVQVGHCVYVIEDEEIAQLKANRVVKITTVSCDLKNQKCSKSLKIRKPPESCPCTRAWS